MKSWRDSEIEDATAEVMVMPNPSAFLLLRFMWFTVGKGDHEITSLSMGAWDDGIMR